MFRASQRRVLRNDGPEPVTRYMMRISADRYPGQPEQSNALYRERPLRWSELALTATCDGEPMTWQPKADRDSFKEAWLCFENDRGRFPLYPGQHATLSYSYTVDDGRWGPWFQRAVRLPTSHLSVDLIFPAALDPVVWGTETSPTAEAVPLRDLYRGVRCLVAVLDRPAPWHTRRLRRGLRSREQGRYPHGRQGSYEASSLRDTRPPPPAPRDRHRPASLRERQGQQLALLISQRGQAVHHPLDVRVQLPVITRRARGTASAGPPSRR
jgi:hypothetical protein